MAKNNKTFYIIIFLAIVITAISYRSYMKNGWYDLDDYYTFDFISAGKSLPQSCRELTYNMYNKQGRFLPVGECIFLTFTRFFEEENSVYYNFALHLINIILLFLLLRKFKAGSIFSLISVLLFAVFGRFRYMDSSIVMIGGSGLNLCLFLTTSLFLIKGLQTSAQRLLMRYVFISLSALAYLLFVFTYEVALPLFVPIVALFYIFNPVNMGLLASFKTKKSFYILLYLIPVLFYGIWFRLLGHHTYSGNTIVWSMNIFIRLKSYILYTLIPPFEMHMPSKSELVVLLLYFIAVIMAMKRDKSEIGRADEKKTGLRLLLFGAVFYSSAVVLFTLNDWKTPTDVMVHHTYLMTAAGAVLLIAFFYNLQWVFPQRLKKKYPAILAIFIFPLFLLNGEYNTVRLYSDNAYQGNDIRNIKKGIETLIPDVDYNLRQG